LFHRGEKKGRQRGAFEFQITAFWAEGSMFGKTMKGEVGAENFRRGERFASPVPYALLIEGTLPTLSGSIQILGDRFLTLSFCCFF